LLQLSAVACTAQQEGAGVGTKECTLCLSLLGLFDLEAGSFMGRNSGGKNKPTKKTTQQLGSSVFSVSPQIKMEYKKLPACFYALRPEKTTMSPSLN